MKFHASEYGSKILIDRRFHVAQGEIFVTSIVILSIDYFPQYFTNCACQKSRLEEPKAEVTLSLE